MTGPSLPAAVLNVEDDEVARYAKSRALRRAGFDVREAGSGAEALKSVEDAEPDLVLLDVNLPDMSGMEVCRRIKADRPHVVVLQISTAFAEKSMRIEGLEAGADSYVTQPIDADELVANVRALLRLKHAEDQLRRVNESLEQRVEERTRDLAIALDRATAEAQNREIAEAALRHAQKMEAIGQLTGGVAHDFNNLLTIIRASTDLLRRNNLSEEKRRRYLNSISETADRAARLTGQLLAFARRQTLHPEVIGVTEKLNGMLSMLQTVVGSRIQIEVVVFCDDCHVLADSSQLEATLINLAVNARDAMDGEGRLTFKLTDATTIPGVRSHPEVTGSFVALSVEDTGTGIAADLLDVIFEPFFTTKEVGKGTGLGLSQVYGFVKQSGGEVRVRSEIGHGTAFVLYLPRSDAPKHQGVVLAKTAAEIVRGNGEVLVVEDNFEVGEFAQRLLDDIGYSATWVESAAEALELVRAAPERFRVVLSDVVMPGMSGIELAELLRGQGFPVPIVLTTGFSNSLATQGPASWSVLHKPYSVATLSRALENAIARGPIGNHSA